MAGLPEKSPWRGRLTKAMALSADAIGVHVAVFVEPFLSAVLDGRKTIESRFSLNRQPPYDCIEPGDIILLKRSGGPVVGIAEAGEAQFFTLSPKVVSSLRERFATQMFAVDDSFWSARRDKNYATLIEIREVVPIRDVTIPKRDRRGWVSYRQRPMERLLPAA